MQFARSLTSTLGKRRASKSPPSAHGSADRSPVKRLRAGSDEPEVQEVIVIEDDEGSANTEKVAARASTSKCKDKGKDKDRGPVKDAQKALDHMKLLQLVRVSERTLG